MYITRVPQPLQPLSDTFSRAATGQAATVLVVDDEPNNLEVMTRFLEDEGFRVVTARDGAEALLAVPEHSPDLILLDVMMPAPEGYEVCRRLKSDPATAQIPVVIVTALSGISERIVGARVGADEFLSKPFDHIELITRARALLQKKRYHDQLLAHSAELERRVDERTAELQQALDELRQLDRLQSEFIANASHELRTPLLHVKGYIDLLADGALGDLTDKQSEGLAVAQAAVGHLEQVVEDVMDFNSLHETRLALEPVSLADVCRNVLHATSALAARRRIAVDLRLPAGSSRVLADRVALTRVLRHLLENAIKFGPLDQAVVLALEPIGEVVRVSVRDNGLGLSPHEIERIFDVFYQVDGSITRRAGGLGVGLALVKKLVQAHGSDVQVTSEPGRGSCFWFDLKRA